MKKKGGIVIHSVIIVDDEYKIREGLIRYFPWEDLGFTIEEGFDNGQSALQYLQDHPVDLVLTDIRMPRYDGLWLIEQIRKRSIPAHIILLSAYPEFDYAKKAIQLGVDGYLLKPVDHQELIESVRKIGEVLDEKAGADDGTAEGYYERYMEQIRNTVADRLGTVTLEMVAAECHLSASYLSHLFREQSGLTFSQYVMNQRMEKSRELLRKNELKIYMIAEQLGYGNSKNYTRAFRNFYGVSPMEYRIQGEKRGNV